MFQLRERLSRSDRQPFLSGERVFISIHRSSDSDMSFAPQEQTELSAVVSDDAKLPGDNRHTYTAYSYDLHELLSGGGNGSGGSAGTAQRYMYKDRALGGYVTTSSGFSLNAIPKVAIVRDKEGRNDPKLLNFYLDSGDKSRGFGSITARVIQPQAFNLEWLDVETADMAQLSAEDATGLVGWACVIGAKPLHRNIPIGTIISLWEQAE